ncbi:MAG: alpha-hydroxy-acid oxidizing protein [Lachnospiraceae bacterium]|nr:alpha-hydroxy-acid oxidizing protein [Lachnospiraceae bacterium]
MTYEDVLERAKQVLSPKCRVCRECNGIACKGEIPGVGAVGSGASFTDCRTYLKSIKLHMDAVHEHFEPDTTFQVFGKVLRAPIMVAPIGGMSFNYTDYLTETQYTQAIVNGALSAGILAFTGDGPKDDYFPSTLPVIEQAGGMSYVFSTVELLHTID